MADQKPNPMCPKCREIGVRIGQGSASQRPQFRCPGGHEWFEKNPAAVALGSLGGKARAESMTPDELSKQGEAAANARWRSEKLKQNVGGNGK